MKVSVIVPVYNHAKYLRQRIDSILNQTYKDYELIILDDWSADGSREIIIEYKSRYPEIIMYFNDHNSGSPFHQWNKGVALSKGEFIWIAESDDFADSHFLERTVSEIGKSGETGFVYSDSRVLDEEKGISYLFSRKIKNNKGHGQTIRSFLENPIPNVSGVLFRKEAFIKAGKADPAMKFCGDWDLYYRIFRNSKIAYLPEPLNTFRLHGGSQFHKYYCSNN